jgi:hypothetical protein
MVSPETDLSTERKGKFGYYQDHRPGLKYWDDYRCCMDDLDGDQQPELIICGEFMPVMVFKKQDGIFVQTVTSGLNEKTGWWNTIEIADINNDHKPDIIAGNHGLNSRFRTSQDQPLCMYVNDFDGNGSVEQIICTYVGGESYPMILRHDLLTRIPALKKKFLSYKDYANKKITDIFDGEQMKNAIRLEAVCFESSVFINNWPAFEQIPLPAQAQFSPVYAIELKDITGDGATDMLIGGNLFGVKPEIGRFDGSDGFLLQGDGKGGFSMNSSGIHLCISGEIRDMSLVSLGKQEVLVIGRSNDSALIIQLP